MFFSGYNFRDKTQVFLHGRFRAFALLVLVCLFFSQALLAAPKYNNIITGSQDKIFASQNRYQPYFEMGGAKYFNQNSNVAGIYDLFIPLYQQRGSQLVFTDLRIFDRSGSSFEGNIHMVTGNYILVQIRIQTQIE